MSDAPEKIWANFNNWRNPHEGRCYRSDSAGGTEYTRSDLSEAEIERLTAERDALAEKLRQRYPGRKPHPVTIRGVTYESKEAAAEALGVSPNTVKYARQHGRLDNVGMGGGYRSEEAARRGNEKKKLTIEMDGSTFRGWAEAKHVTGLSRQTLIRRGAKIYRGESDD